MLLYVCVAFDEPNFVEPVYVCFCWDELDVLVIGVDLTNIGEICVERWVFGLEIVTRF